MRIFALLAFVALQLSIFTCGTNIHAHSLVDSGGSHLAQQDSTPDSPKHTPVDQSCQIHASHVFLDQGPDNHRTPQILPIRSLIWQHYLFA